MKTSSTKGELPLVPEAYDFRDVGQAEQEACCLYEYARESRAVRKEVQSVIRQLKEPAPAGKTIKFSFEGSLIQSSIVMNLSLISGFPTAAFQLLSGRDRRVALRGPTVAT